MNKLDILDKIHPDLISAFLTTGKCDGITPDVQIFLKQLQWAAEIYEYERNITRAAKQLRQRINAGQQINIDERTCKARIYAAINYFSIDNNVSIKVWESNYADKYEDLAKLCAAAEDYKTMGKCYAAALECRRRASEIAEADRDLGIVFLSLRNSVRKTSVTAKPHSRKLPPSTTKASTSISSTTFLSKKSRRNVSSVMPISRRRNMKN